MAGKKNTPQYETRTGTPTTEQGDEIRILSTQARLPPHVQLDKDAFEAEERTLTLRRLRAQAEEAEAIADAAKGRASALAATREALSLEDSPSELSPQGLSVVSKHPGIDPKQIGLIVKNTFEPWNLYKLRRGSLQVDRQDSTTISIGDTGLVSRKVVGLPKDYGNSINLWMGCFTTYTSILYQLYGEHHPDLVHALLAFSSKIQSLVDPHPYNWPRQVLPLAMAVHTLAYAQGITNPESWHVSRELVDTWCGNLIVEAPSQPSRKRSHDGLPRHNNGNDKGFNTPKSAYGKRVAAQVCQLWNATEGCSRGDSCWRKHECSKCGAEEHNILRCKS
jgi:hypothetical protein